MKKADDGTIEEILCDLTHYEDRDTSLTIMSTESGGVFVMPWDGTYDLMFEGDTLKEALLKLGRASIKKYPWILEDEYLKLDWS